MTSPAHREILRNGIDRLPEKDRGFAASLCRAKYPSPKQWEWIGKMADRITNPPAKRETVTVGNMAGIAALFSAAATQLQFPAIVLINPHRSGELLKLTIAGPTAAVPGSINVKDKDGARRWYGRILSDGQFELSPRVRADEIHGIIVKLQELAADPVRVATEHGRLTGHCCFCNLPLKDERSTGVGYGRTCANNWNLPWGSAKTTFANVEVHQVQTPAPPVRRSTRKLKVAR